MGQIIVSLLPPALPCHGSGSRSLCRRKPASARAHLGVRSAVVPAVEPPGLVGTRAISRQPPDRRTFARPPSEGSLALPARRESGRETLQSSPTAYLVRKPLSRGSRS